MPALSCSCTRLQERLERCYRLFVGLHAVALLQRRKTGTVEGQEIRPAIGQPRRRVRRVPPRTALPCLQHRLLRCYTAHRHQFAQLRACNMQERARVLTDGGRARRARRVFGAEPAQADGMAVELQWSLPSCRAIQAPTVCK